MANASQLESNSILFSKRRLNFHCNTCFTKPARLAIESTKFTVSSRFNNVKVQSFVNSGSNSTGNSSTTVRSSSKRNALDKDDCEGMEWFNPPATMLLLTLCLYILKMTRPYPPPNYSQPKEYVCQEIPSTVRHSPTGSANNGPSCHGAKQHSEIFHRYVMGEIYPVFLFIYYGRLTFIEYKKTKYNVIKLQVALSMYGRSYDFELSRILRRHDTSSSDGRADLLKNITTKLLEDVVLSVAGYSSTKMCESVQDAEEYFKQLSKEEEEKFDELNNLKNIKKKITIFNEVQDWERRFVVVTVLIVARGGAAANFPNFIAHKDTAIHDIRGAINQLGIIDDSRKIKAVDLFWTPQNEDGIMSLDELRKHYPFLTLSPYYATRYSGLDYLACLS